MYEVEVSIVEVAVVVGLVVIIAILTIAVVVVSTDILLVVAPLANVVEEVVLVEIHADKC